MLLVKGTFVGQDRCTTAFIFFAFYHVTYHSINDFSAEAAGLCFLGLKVN